MTWPHATARVSAAPQTWAQMSRKKLRRKNQRRNSINPVRELIKNNWGKLLTGITSLLIAGAGWYLATCLSNRKALIKEFRETALSFQLMDEKMFEDSEVLDEEIKYFLDYLEEGHLELAATQERTSKIELLIQSVNDDCDTLREAYYKWKADVEIVSREFFLPPPVLQEFFPVRCGGLTQMKVTMPDAQQLVQDSTLRLDVISDLKPYFAELEEIKRQSSPLHPERRRLNVDLLTTIEARDSAIAKGIWDCFKQLCGIRPR